MKRGTIVFFILCAVASWASGPMMVEKLDCGRSCIIYVTGRSLADVTSAMHWKSYGDSRDDACDTPLNHYAALQTLGFGYQIVTCGQITSGQATNEKTIILIHEPEHPLLVQHWTVLQKVDAQAVYLYFDDGTAHRFTIADFTNLYRAGTPACAYTVVQPAGSVPWYAKFWSWMWGRI